ncbi:gliding motility-associated C-terminal domain-containing protein [Foetidibacter luteolus]|uniref:T9SS type B sorting domain-containing protein n=1 Tax=Foetidibacter luteolus TaxID=2608880 RepID=UPI001A99CED8|nr:gliding motility-associated C-terminal domain-containing protein [Foetidibacter luteolus]
MRYQSLIAYIFICITCLPFALFVQAQAPVSWACGDDSLDSIANQFVPNYRLLEQRSNLRIKSYIQDKLVNTNDRLFGSGSPGDSIYTIPVVVHVVYSAGQAYGTGANISYGQIRSQLEALNAAFSKSYPDYNGQSSPAYAQDTRIRFCLARIASQGKSWYAGPGGTEYGVMRYPDNAFAYNHDISIESARELLSVTHPSATDFPTSKFFNIWLVQTIGGGNNIMGYAPKPLMGAYPLDGVVIRADIFGDNTAGGSYPLSYGLTQGKVLAHELGHYLNLYHIFQGGCAGANRSGSSSDACDMYGDYICDIEPSITQNVLCNNGTYNTCTTNYNTGTVDYDMINDFMSYADDDCMNTFTLNQVQRMWATLNLDRRTLWQASNLVETGVFGNEGCIPPYLNALINTDNNVFCAGTPVRFSNPVAGNTATKYEWLFSGGNPATAHKDTATVFYNTPGEYKAVLMVSDGVNTRRDSLLFSVITCQLDSSLQHMAHWYFGYFCSLDFSSGLPVKTNTALANYTMQGESTYPGQLPSVSATVSLSDSSGNLLFYSNGVSVWNSKHQKINKSSILGKSDINASTGICYVPFPGDPGKYFIAGIYPNFNETDCGVRFALIDLASNTVQQYREFNHSSLPRRFSEFLTVVPHCNGTDYWIIVKGFNQDKNFYSFLVTVNGIDAGQAPVISGGFTHPGYGGSGNQLKANKQGNKLMLASPHGYVNIEAGALYDFDSRTGEVKNEKQIPNVPGYNNVQSGTAFSPNGEYFYLMRSSNLATNGPPYWMFQYRVSDMQYNILATTGFYFSHPFQLGPDKQLYIVNGYNYLAKLSNPDLWGGAAFNGEFISFSEGSFSMSAGVSLPAFIDAKRPEPTHPEFIVEPVNCQSFTFTALCFDDYTASWDMGDGSPIQTGHVVNYTYNESGVFNVTLTLSKAAWAYGSTTKKVIVLPLTASITGLDTVCITQSFTSQYYANNLPGADYKWSITNGAVQGLDNLSYVDIVWPGGRNTGQVKVTLSREKCSISATRNVVINNRPVIEWNVKNRVCITDAPFALQATPAGGAYTGNGVQNNMFYPSTAGKGNHILTYTYASGSDCFAQIDKTIEVNTTCVPPVIDTSLFRGPGIPSAFTPNNDGLNDVFRIPYDASFQVKQLSIYNRWGQIIYSSRNILKGWDGTIKGLPAPPATYIYSVTGTRTDGSPVTFKGFVVLMR